MIDTLRAMWFNVWTAKLDVAYYFVAWVFPLALLSLILILIAMYGYAGTVDRFADVLAAMQRLVNRFWSAMVRAIRRHACESYKRHNRRWEECHESSRTD